MILLDTSVLIELFRTKDKTKTFFFQLSEKEDRFAISTLTYYEIMIGTNDTQTRFWDVFFEFIKIIPFDITCSVEAAQIYKDLKKRNKLIELSDLAIAATAISNRLPIATNNTKHFERIEHLKIIGKH
jgi:tRNA(fMet)-specific endonuclease VapC